MKEGPGMKRRDFLKAAGAVGAIPGLAQAQSPELPYDIVRTKTDALLKALRDAYVPLEGRVPATIGRSFNSIPKDGDVLSAHKENLGRVRREAESLRETVYLFARLIMTAVQKGEIEKNSGIQAASAIHKALEAFDTK